MEEDKARRTLAEWQLFINELVEKHGEDAPAYFHRTYGFLIVDQKPNARGGYVDGTYYSLTRLAEV